MQKLQQFNERSLSIVASILGRCDAVVIHSERLKHPIAVTFEGWAILVDPNRAGLRDLFVAAYLLRWRSEARKLSEDSTRRKGHIKRSLSRPWVQNAVAQLEQEYPKLLDFPGIFHLSAEESWPELSWRQAEFTPLPPLLSTIDSNFLEGFGWHQSSMVEFTGNKKDFDHFLAALNLGIYPLKQEPHLPEMPYAYLPIKISTTGGAGPRFEQYEWEVKNHERQFGTIQKLVECQIRASEEDSPQQFLGQHLADGVIFDPNRLSEIVVARRTGIPPRVFLDPTASAKRYYFDPERHLNVVMVDLNGLARAYGEGPQFSYRSLGVFCEVQRELGLRCAVIGFCDHVIRTERRGSIYIHCPVNLKGFDDPWDAAYFQRLQSVIERPPQLPRPAIPACFQPLQLRTAFELSSAYSEDLALESHGVVVVAKNGMPKWPELTTREFYARTADAFDTLFVDQEHKVNTTVKCWVALLPEELRANCRKDGKVSRSV